MFENYAGGRATGADAGEDAAARGGRAGGSTHARGRTRGGRGQSADTEYLPAQENNKSCAHTKVVPAAKTNSEEADHTS